MDDLKCPKCGNELQKGEGCYKCSNCGYETNNIDWESRCKELQKELVVLREINLNNIEETNNYKVAYEGLQKRIDGITKEKIKECIVYDYDISIHETETIDKLFNLTKGGGV